MGTIEEVRQGIWGNSSSNVPTMIAGITTHGVKRLPMAGKHDIELSGLGHIEIGYSSANNKLESHTHPTLLLNELQRSSILSTAILPPHVFLLHQLYKLATNAAINPLTAIFKVPNGDILKSLPFVEQILDEVTRVFLKLPETGSEGFSANGNREDILGTHALVKRTMDLVERTAGNTSSMLADVLAGRETEIEYINGWVVRKGKELGVECPVNEELMNRIKELHVRS